MAKAKGFNLAAASARFDGEFGKKSGTGLGSDAMSNRKFIAPKLALIWFWLFSIVSVLTALVLVCTILQESPSFSAILPLILCVLGILAARVVYECIVVLFAIEKNTRKTRDLNEKGLKAQIEGNNALIGIRDTLLRIEEKMDSRGETAAPAEDGIVVECPHCGSTIRLPNDIQNGQNVRCSSCGNKFQYVG